MFVFWIYSIYVVLFIYLAIREAGGAFGKIEAAREEDYFLRMVRVDAISLLSSIIAF